MLSKIKFFFEQSWLLIVASFAFGLLLAVTNASWQPRIIKNQQEKFSGLASTLLTDANSFETTLSNVVIKPDAGKDLQTDVSKVLDENGQCIGWVFICEGGGFVDVIKLVLAVDSDFKTIKGYGVLESYETVDFGDRIKFDYYRNQFIGAPTTGLTLSKTGDDKVIDSEIIAITGATVSSEAVVNILNTYIPQVKTQLEMKGLIENDR